MPLRNRPLKMGNKRVEGVSDAVDAKDAVNKSQMDTAISAAVGSIDLSGYVPNSRTITAGTGLSGGGDLSANRTIDLEDTAVAPGSYTLSSITVDAQGRITAASNGNLTLPFTSLFKSADQSITSNVTPADLTGLVFAADAASTYVVHFVLFITAGAGGSRIDMESTSALTSGFKSQGFASGAADAHGADNTTGAGNYCIEYFAYLVTNGATTISVRGAQSSSNIAATVFKKGSFLEYRKIV